MTSKEPKSRTKVVVRRAVVEISIKAGRDKLGAIYASLLPDVKGSSNSNTLSLSLEKDVLILRIEEREISHLRAGIGSNLRLAALALDMCST